MSVTTCYDAPAISPDTEKTIIDERRKVNYKCPNDHFLNFPHISYPNDVDAVCEVNQTFHLLPFWKIAGETFPLNPKNNMCLNRTSCHKAPPTMPTHLTKIGRENNTVGTRYKYFCEIDGARGSVEFTTSIDEVFSAFETLTKQQDIRFYNFRPRRSSEDKNSMISLKVNATETVYIYFSEEESYTEETLVNNTYCLEINQKGFKLWRFALLLNENKGKVEWSEDILDEKVLKIDNNIIDFWLAMNSLELVLGSWTNEDEILKISNYKMLNMKEIVFAGFASLSTAHWKIRNGIHK